MQITDAEAAVWHGCRGEVTLNNALHKPGQAEELRLISVFPRSQAPERILHQASLAQT